MSATIFLLGLCGDGGFLFTGNEIATAVQFGINAVGVVFADGAYGNVRRMQANLHGGKMISTELRNLSSDKRAILMNPEVIVCHKPTALLDEAQTDATMDMFRVSSQTCPPCYCPTTTPFWGVP